MKKNKFLHSFIAVLHCALMAVPAVVLGYNVLYSTIQSNQSYTTQITYDSEGNFTETTRLYSTDELIKLGFKNTLVDFDYIDSTNDYTIQDWSNAYASSIGFPFLMNNDFLGLFDLGNSTLGSSAYVYLFVNFYLNWLINMSVIVFTPEIILVFIDICRKLIYSFSHKIEGGF